MHSIDQLFGQASRARKDGRYADARASLDAVILIAQRHADHVLRAQALTVKAQIEHDAGHFVAAVPLYEEAILLYRSTSDVLALAATLRHLGDAYQTREEYDEASARYEEALTIYRAVDDGADDARLVYQSAEQCRRGWSSTDRAAS